jgi:hypothetical protein
MNTVVWIAQALLAVAMLGAGAMKLSQTKAQLQASGSMDWVEHKTEGQIKGIGTLEVLAAVGLIVPAVLDIAPVLVRYRRRRGRPAHARGRRHPPSPRRGPDGAGQPRHRRDRRLRRDHALRARGLLARTAGVVAIST